MKETAFMTAAEVADEIFGFSEDWFRKTRAQLEAQGFPAPVRLPARAAEKSSRGTEKWVRPFVMAWVLKQGPATLADMAARLAGAMPPRPEATADARNDNYKLQKRF